MLLPSSVREWVAVFRGDVAPPLILLSALLGFWFGLMPGFYGLHVGLLAVALVVNVNLGIVLIFAALGKGLCFAAAPVLYHTGVWVHESAPGLAATVASIPILGISDFSRYALLGGMVLGPPAGLVLGIALALLVQSYRRAWLKLENQSEALRRWQAKTWVRWLDRILVGKSRSATEALARRARYVRVPGVALAVVVVAVFSGTAYYFRNTVLTDYAAQSLTAVNGAEVNLAQFEVLPLRGSLSASRIRATDPEKPANNRVAIETLSADVSLWSLLLGRVELDEVVLSDVQFDTRRDAAGRVVPRPGLPKLPPFDPARFDLTDLDPAKLEGYWKQAQQVRDWTAKLSEWLPALELEKYKAPERYLEYLTARAFGPAAPRFVVRRLVLEPVTPPIEALGESSVICRNLSDAPRALGDPIIIGVKSRKGTAACEVSCRFDGDVVEVSATLENLDLKAFQKQLNSKNPVVLSGGTASATISGRITREFIDLAVKVRTKDLTCSTAGGGLFGLDPQISSEAMKLLRNLETTLRIVGPLNEPRLAFDSNAMRASMREALVQAGKDEMLRRMDQLLGDKLGGAGLGEKGLKVSPGDVGKGISGLLGGQKKNED